MRPFDLFFQLNSRINGPTKSPTFLYRCNSTFLWCSWAFLIKYMKKNLHFCNIKKTHCGRTDGRTDRPSYRDARTHLKIADRIGIAHFWSHFYQFSAMKTKKIYDGRRGSHFECNYRSLSLFVWEILVKKGGKNMSEKKWNYAKRAPQCLHMLRKAMLQGMKAIIDVKREVTKYWPVHDICAQQMNYLLVLESKHWW